MDDRRDQASHALFCKGLVRYWQAQKALRRKDDSNGVGDESLEQVPREQIG